MANGNGRKNGNGKAQLPAPRCAIYTRKSTAIGLEQEFNSLDAQRDACEAYIKAQAHQGWVALDTRYDDGGFTGTNTDRPAFRRLIADLAAGRIDVVVVYKVDRLSRSLLDFVQVMDLFNRHGVAFVSVTQNFSTTESIGKLTLNLLISFSSFERDMISDRTRDKIAAARRRGLWTGGTVPLGYDVVDKHLVVNETEAARARQIFELYTQHGSALTVAHLLNQAGHRTKRHEARTGRIKEARPWNKADVLRVLRNPLYAGCMASGGDLYPGEHEGLIDRAVFDCVQADLHDHGGERRPAVRNPAYLLRGILRCGCCGRALTAASNRRKGREYRYYRCVSYDKGGRDACPATSVAAGPIEDFVLEKIREISRSGESLRHCPTWVAEVLAEFDCVWETMTQINRSRLVRALVKRAEFDAVTGTMVVTMADFATPADIPGAGPSPAFEGIRLEACS